MRSQDGSSTRPNFPDFDHADSDRTLVLCVLLSLAMIGLIASPWTRQPVAVSHDAVRSAVNADDAPWWELTVLPDIGPAIAGEIVHYRESMSSDDSRRPRSQVFTQASDLARVRGIGPKTVERISSDLYFGDD